MQQHFFVQSNGGSGMRWWTRDDNDATIQTRQPAAYRWILEKRLFQWNHTALALYVTGEGRMCCLLNGIRSGKIVGNSRVLDSLLVVNAEPRLTEVQRRLTIAFLRTCLPDTKEEEFSSSEGGLVPVLKAIQAAGDVKVDWIAMRNAIDAVPEAFMTAAHAGNSWGEDNRQNRSLLGAFLNRCGRAQPGTLIAVVAPFACKQEFRAAKVARGLSTDRSLKGKRLKVRVMDVEHPLPTAPIEKEPRAPVENPEPKSLVLRREETALTVFVSNGDGEPRNFPGPAALFEIAWKHLQELITRLFSATHPAE